MIILKLMCTPNTISEFMCKICIKIADFSNTEGKERLPKIPENVPENEEPSRAEELTHAIVS